MNSTTIASLVLGSGGLLTGAGLIWKIVVELLDRRRSVDKQEGEIKLDTATERRIAAEAAQINSDVAIAQQNWWKEQFDAVRTELVEEQRLRRALSKWASDHQEWDQRAWTLALKADPDCPPPPELEYEQ